LSARLETDAGVDAWLQVVGEDRVEASLSRLGWLEPDESGSGGDALAPAA